MPSIPIEIDSGEGKEGGMGLMPPPPSTPPAGKISPARLLKVREGSNKIVVDATEESKLACGMNSSLVHDTTATLNSNIINKTIIETVPIIDNSVAPTRGALIKKGGASHNFFRGTVRKVDLPEKKIIARDWKGIGKPSRVVESKVKDEKIESNVIDLLEFDDDIEDKMKSPVGKLPSKEVKDSFDDVIKINNIHADEPQYKMALKYVANEEKSNFGKDESPFLSATEKKILDIKSSLLLDNSDMETRLTRGESKSQSSEVDVVTTVVDVARLTRG